MPARGPFRNDLGTQGDHNSLPNPSPSNGYHSPTLLVRCSIVIRRRLTRRRMKILRLRSSIERIIPSFSPESPRVRLRGAVRAADCPPRARPSCVLGDRAVRHHRRGGTRDVAVRHHLIGRPGERERRRRPARRPCDLRAGRADARLLLWASDHGGDARRHRVPPRGGRIRPRDASR